MNRKTFFLVFICMLFSCLVYARGKKDVETRVPETPESWSETFDISGKKRSKYNVVITAEDIAGNVGINGPFNMYIDPKSDYPVIRVNNPVPNMFVNGNINVSGTCFDDDDVDHVLVSLDNGEPQRAKGSQFWSCFFDTSYLAEGLHTVSAWGVDVHGLKGMPVSVRFHLNRHIPETKITNLDPGALVSGKFSLEGVVEDGNGVDKLFYSTDKGETYIPVPLKHKKNLKTSSFKLGVDTRKMTEGPTIFWFKAVDKLGSEGISTFLCFVDNTPPSIQFSYPPESEICSSVFAVGGSVTDTVELEAVAWKAGKESGTFDLIKGNPYWVKEFDFSMSQNKAETIEIIAKDSAGNVTTVKRTIKIDKAKDLPRVNIMLPASGSMVDGTLYLAGSVENITQDAEVFYQIDKGEEKMLPVSFGPFGVHIENVPAGKHVLSVYAVNNHKRKGPVKTVHFSSMGAKPKAMFEKDTGFIQKIPADSKAPIGIIVSSEAGLDTLSYVIDEGIETVVPIKKGTQTGFIKIPITPAYREKTTAIRITAVDIFNRVTQQTFAVYCEKQTESAFLWVKGEINTEETVVLSKDAVLTGLYIPPEGIGIESVSLKNNHDAFDVSFNGYAIMLTGKKDGSYKDVELIITGTDGSTFTAEPIHILVDTTPPAVTASRPDEPMLISGGIELSGAVTDSSAVQVSYTLNAGEPVPVSPSYSVVIPAKDIDDGLVVIGIHAVDTIGQKTSLYRLFYKDSTPPKAEIIFPKENDIINGTILIAFKVDDALPLGKAEYLPEGKGVQWVPVEVTPIIHTLIGSSAEPITKGMQFKFTDKAGNHVLFSDYPFQIDVEADKPVLEIHLPYENEIITKDFTLSGIAYDDDGMSKVYYRIDDAPLKTMEVTNSFTIPFNLSDFTDNEHSIFIYGEDIYGVKSTVFERKVRISLEAPHVEMKAPALTAMVRDTIAITGIASDKNGIERVFVSVDNGVTYNLAEGTTDWRYMLDTHVIKDGTHVVFIKVEDKYGEQTTISSLLNIDNTNPSLNFEYPIAGGRYDNVLLISGQMYDILGLVGAAVRIKGLQGQTIPADLAEVKLPDNLLVKKELNIAALAEGNYNLEITAIDKAGNVTNVARNFEIRRSETASKISILYPLNGETIVGEFNVYGKITSTTYPEQAFLYVNGRELGSSSISPTGYFSFRVTEEAGLSAGTHSITVKAAIVSQKKEEAPVHTITYNPAGPWVTIDNFAMGDFATERPFLKGKAGYVLSEEDRALLTAKGTPKDVRYAIAQKKVKSIELSFDNGRTFIPLGTKNKWKYRLETADMAEGNHYILVKAIMKNDEIAVCRTIVHVDKTLPSIRLITPNAGGRYNETLEYSGLASDNIAVTKVQMQLRKGDKYLYTVPQAMQGLHFDVGFLGATLWNVAFGLSFFDHKVKLQLHYGQMLPLQWRKITSTSTDQKMRYGGHVISAKILANVFELPFASFAGPDWAWLHMTGAVGAVFSVFTETQSTKVQVLSAMLAQIEFPRVKLPPKKVKYFNTFAFYTEGQLWFIPTDVNSGGIQSGQLIKSIIPRIAFGVRVSVF